MRKFILLGSISVCAAFLALAGCGKGEDPYKVPKPVPRPVGEGAINPDTPGGAGSPSTSPTAPPPPPGG